jgi:hypothetical protein
LYEDPNGMTRPIPYVKHWQKFLFSFALDAHQVCGYPPGIMEKKIDLKRGLMICFSKCVAFCGGKIILDNMASRYSQNILPLCYM